MSLMFTADIIPTIDLLTDSGDDVPDAELLTACATVQAIGGLTASPNSRNDSNYDISDAEILEACTKVEALMDGLAGTPPHFHVQSQCWLVMCVCGTLRCF